MSYHRVPLRTCLILLLLTINDVINQTITRHNHDYDDAENLFRQTALAPFSNKLARAPDNDVLKALRFPKNSKGTVKKTHSTHSSAVNFMLSVSEKYSNSESIRTTIAYMAQRSDQEVDGTSVIMRFNVSHKLPERELISAKLKLYRRQDVKDDGNRGSFTVTVHRLSRTEDGKRDMHLVDSVIAPVGQEGWLTLDVMESLQHWLKYPEDNKDIRVSVHPTDFPSHETRPEDIGIVGLNGRAEYQPFMVTSFRPKETYQPQPPIFQSAFNFRDYAISLGNNTKNRTSGGKNVFVKRHADTDSRKPRHECHVESFSVSIEDLGWQISVIAPERLNINYCSGHCKFPPSGPKKISAHGIVKSIVSRFTPYEVPCPCCVPTSVSSIDILYYSDNTTIVMEKWAGMKVKSCACQ